MGSERWRVRRAARTDIDRLVEIARGDPMGGWGRKQLESEFDIEWSAVDVVVRPDGLVVGLSVCWRVAGELQLLYLATDPAYRRMGVARQLVQHLQQWAGRLERGRIELEVERTNTPALELYAAMGFSVVGRRPSYYAERQADAWLMDWQSPGDGDDRG